MSRAKSILEAVQDAKLRVEELEEGIDPIEPVIKVHELLPGVLPVLHDEAGML